MVLSEMTDFWRRVQESIVVAVGSVVSEERVVSTRPGAVSVSPIVGPDDPDPGSQELRTLGGVSVQPGDRVLVMRLPALKFVLGKLSIRGVSSTVDNRGHHAADDEATVIGELAEAFARQATSVGWRAKATNLYATAIGAQAEATGDRSTAVGIFALAQALRSVAIGRNTLAQHTDSIALGNSAETTASNQLMLGNIFRIVSAAGPVQHQARALAVTDNSLGSGFSTAGTRTHANGTITGLSDFLTYDVYAITLIQFDANGTASGSLYSTTWIGSSGETMGQAFAQTVGLETTTSVCIATKVVSGVTSEVVSARSVWVAGTARHRGSSVFAIAIPRPV